jgi:large conductance mechanosensitive channel
MSLQETTPLLTVSNSVDNVIDLVHDFAEDVQEFAEDVVERTARLTFWKEFQEFLGSRNLIEVAIGIIVGNEFSSLLNAFMEEILLPPMTFLSFGSMLKDSFLVLKQGATKTIYPTLEETLADGAVVIAFGSFAQKVLQFLLQGFVLFFVIKLYLALKTRLSIAKKKEAPPAILTKVCEWCCEDIRLEAKKCKYCSSQCSKLSF